MSVRFELQGMSELRAALRRLPEELRSEGGVHVAERADEAFTEIGNAYPEYTGNLKKQLRKSVEQSSFGVTATIKNTAKHAWLFENGTQMRKTASGANRGAMPPGKVFIPNMIRARRKLTEDLKDLLRRAGLEVSGG